MSAGQQRWPPASGPESAQRPHPIEFQPGPRQRQGAARFCRVLAWALFLAGMVLAVSVGLALAAAPFLLLSYLLMRQSKKYSAPRADTILRQDSRPPVVYLRSFSDESNDQSFSSYFRGAWSPTIAGSVPGWAPREQDSLAPILSQVGPYVAIGKPGERLPELGASRAYVSDSDWQTCVSQWISAARLIVIRTGATRGLRWELGEVVRQGKLTCLLLILPSRADDYSAFREWACEVLPHQLPNQQPRQRLMIFNLTLQPAPLPARTTVTKTLQPFLLQNGLHVKQSFARAVLEHNGFN